MASLVTFEKCAFANGGFSELKGIEVMTNSNDLILKPLMEELQDHVEEGDEERLNCVIQSLEAEINLSTMDRVCHDSCTEMELEPNHHHQSISEGAQDSQSCSLGQTDDHCCSVLVDDLDVNGWINNMVIEAVPCSPSHDMNCDMSRLGYELNISVIGFEGINTIDYSAHTSYGSVVLEKELDDGYNSLWQEYDSVIYN